MAPELDFTLFCVSLLVSLAAGWQLWKKPHPSTLGLLWISSSICVETHLRLLWVFALMSCLGWYLFWPKKDFPKKNYPKRDFPKRDFPKQTPRPPQGRFQLPPNLRPPWEQV